MLAFGSSCNREGSSQLWPAIERVSAFAGFRFDILGDELDALGFCEPGDSCALCFDAKSGAVLLLCGDTILGNSASHTN